MNSIKNKKGQSLVEFAIILPILLLLLLGIGEFGIMLNSYLTIQNVAREGARLGIVGGSDVEIIALIRTTSPNLTATDMSITITPLEANRRSGDTLQVIIAYNYYMTVPIISSLVGNIIVLTAQTSMRIEWVVSVMRGRRKKGSVSIILCIAILGLFGFAAYSIDIGIIYVQKTKLTNAIDSSVLAASLELPQNPTNARAVATEYLQKNDIDPSGFIIGISIDNKSIEIEGTRNVNHLFAPFIGINHSIVSATAKAQIGPINAVVGGVRPFAVEIYNFNYGQLITLKEGAGSGYHGNYGAVRLGGNGASVFKANALYGYSGTLTVGDYIDTEPGNMAGATNAIQNYINSEQSTFQNFTRESIRLWTIPVVDSLEVNGSKSVLIVGFAEFYVENIVGQSGKINVTGRFIKFVTKGEIDVTLTDTGLYGVKLVK